jgi:D-alanyl-D-alanine carboxypeptidase
MAGYDTLLAAMKAAGFQPSLQSAYRSYKAQCGTFGHWAGASSACKASQQSALPGHSQHQLGTVVDLFTEAWRMSGPGVFRHGFGCNKAGEFIRDEAWKYGWIVAYPIHPDDRQAKQPCEPRFDLPVTINAATGYGHEAWHIRFVGVDHARDFHEASSKDETLTLEQWLRAKRGLPVAVATELPVCDGCNCGACASLAPEAGACKDALPVPVATPGPIPTHTTATRTREGDHVVVTVHVHVEAGVTTQPPLFRSGKLGYAVGETFTSVASVEAGGQRAFPDATGTIRIGARATGAEWPYRVALPTATATTVYDRANVVLPAATGDGTVVLVVPDAITEVALLRDGKPTSTLPATESPAARAN